MLGLDKGKVRLANHDKKWAAVYTEERARLERKLGKLVSQLEHVGSTAIPGIRAKPVVDILIGAKTGADVAPIQMALIDDGAERIGDLAGPRITLFVKGNPRTFHYHVTRYGNGHWQRFVRIRDHLRRHAGLAREYDKLKGELARQFPEDRVSYTHGKVPFLDAVDQRAASESKLRVLARLIAERESELEENVAGSLWTRGPTPLKPPQIRGKAKALKKAPSASKKKERKAKATIKVRRQPARSRRFRSKER